jgi:hypothetical protein
MVYQDAALEIDEVRGEEQPPIWVISPVNKWNKALPPMASCGNKQDRGGHIHQ